MPSDTTFSKPEFSKPAFRDWFSFEGGRASPWWRPWLGTLLISAVIAVGFTMLGFVMHARGDGAWRNWRGWLDWYGINLVISVCVGVAIRLLFMGLIPLVGRARIRALGHLPRALFFSGVPLLGTALGAPLGLWLTGQAGRIWINTSDANAIAGSVLLSVLISSIFYLVFNARARQVEAETRAAEAQLRLLQGQIEPHFLFNTLANVIGLIDHDAAKARAMLESFTDYLRTSLGSLRHGQATLGSELELARTYLCLLQTRMEDRLQFSIDADPALADVPLPPLLLQPLVENAIHHGLEPKVEGGQVRVTTRREGAVLVLQVADNGLGLHAPQRRRSGAGMALVNLRERLQAQYGNAASLVLSEAEPGTGTSTNTGTVATLRVPIPSTLK